MPKFQDMTVWRQAEALMQPAFIRLVANIGKQLEQSTWKGQYEDVLVWAEGIDDATKAKVLQLRSDLEQASNASTDSNPSTEVDEIERTLATLPSPYPGYQLCLTQNSQQVRVDLWELCYRICFRDYDAESGTSRNRGFGQPPSQSVEVDRTLFDETGEVDWNRLDDKTKSLVDQIFTNLPA
ncbi:MAG: hypothetical protein IGS48_06160 [Oscillatoriales cyanobacterium C42_A2020_001]|nr:hypothetical protein [Leptolyngbyaceae cyanobacterium C42_A2020_001]